MKNAVSFIAFCLLSLSTQAYSYSGWTYNLNEAFHNAASNLCPAGSRYGVHQERSLGAGRVQYTVNCGMMNFRTFTCYSQQDNKSRPVYRCG